MEQLIADLQTKEPQSSFSGEVFVRDIRRVRERSPTYKTADVQLYVHQGKRYVLIKYQDLRQNELFDIQRFSNFPVKAPSGTLLCVDLEDGSTLNIKLEAKETLRKFYLEIRKLALGCPVTFARARSVESDGMQNVVQRTKRAAPAAAASATKSGGALKAKRAKVKAEVKDDQISPRRQKQPQRKVQPLRVMHVHHLLNPVELRSCADRWLQEDLPPLDVGGAVVGSGPARAELRCKESCVLAGRPFVDAIFGQLNCDVEWLFEDGVSLKAPCVAAVVRGAAKDILLGERTALNVLTRACGVATVTNRCVTKALESDWNGRVAATRKTTPGFRIVEKYAVIVGGGDTHRYSLSTMVMLKDNHIWACENDFSIAISNAKHNTGFSQKVEVETGTRDEAFEAAQCGADVVMLDNFEPQAAKNVAAELKRSYPSLTVEVSGGINYENMENYFGSNIDVISMSALTQGYDTIDLSLKIVT